MVKRKAILAIIALALAASSASAQLYVEVPGPGPLPSPWTIDGSTIYRTGGPVGVGTTAPNTNNSLTLKAIGTGAPLNLFPQSTPASPNNGDMWSTTSGIFARINDATIGPFISTATIPLTSAHLLVGNGSNFAASVAMSGDATIANTGALTLTSTNTTLSILTGITSINAGTSGATFGEVLHSGTNNTRSTNSQITLADTVSSGIVGHGFSVSRVYDFDASGGINDYDSRDLFQGTHDTDHHAGFQYIPEFNANGTLGHMYALISNPLIDQGTVTNYEAISIRAPVVSGGSITRRTPVVTEQGAGNTCLGAVITANVVASGCDRWNFSVGRQTNVSDTGNNTTLGVGMNMVAVPFNGDPSWCYNCYNNSGSWAYAISDEASKITFGGNTHPLTISTAASGTADGTITWTDVASFKSTGIDAIGYLAGGTAGVDCPSGVTAATVVVVKGIITHC